MLYNHAAHSSFFSRPPLPPPHPARYQPVPGLCCKLNLRHRCVSNKMNISISSLAISTKRLPTRILENGARRSRRIRRSRGRSPWRGTPTLGSASWRGRRNQSLSGGFQNSREIPSGKINYRLNLQIKK